jgi:4-hydroxy-L-threonine phosphate dehydrogenase PdxA
MFFFIKIIAFEKKSNRHRNFAIIRVILDDGVAYDLQPK